MASVKVAVRVRPVNARERSLDSEVIIEIAGKTITVTNAKVPDHTVGDQNREKTKVFTFDHSYWSVDPADSHYVSQEQVFADLGSDIIECAFNGYNACVFAYGQTGSGKTYTMTGNPGDSGLIPRISNGLFQQMTDESKTYRTEVSYFEIYNEAVRDLLPSNANKGNQALRVREHPKDGPYVEDLSCHLVTSYEDIKELIDQGNARRTTAATNMNDVSSRSHAIFTIAFTQATFSKNSPSETYSKIRLVDLAGSERADATGNTGMRLKEGGSINKSLVTLSNVISTLAELCEKGTSKKNAYIPYRDSVLTWLLKDSLGGNSKTIMIATISPAGCNYMETVSTLRYANRAKNIINKPKVNEDPNVKLIRELRAEIARLKALLGGNIDEFSTPKLQELLSENEAKVKVLTEAWTGRWRETAAILKDGGALALRRDGLGVVLDSDLPHLIGIDDDVLSTGMILYHLKEGQTTIGAESADEKQNIVLQGPDVQPEHCVVTNEHEEVSLIPMTNAECYVNGVIVNSAVTLSQGDIIILGRTNMFRFNHPLQATKLRKEMKESNLSLSRMSLLSQSRLELFRSSDNLSWSTAAAAAAGCDVEQQHKEQLEALDRKRREVEEMEEKLHLAESDLQTRRMQEEEELERRRENLEKMQAEAEKMKREAEMVQKQAKQEVSELKEKSMNFEKQLQRYCQLNGRSIQLEVSGDVGAGEEEREGGGGGSVDNHPLPSSQLQHLQSELTKLDDFIQLLKRLQIDYNLFDSISADFDDPVRSEIQKEIKDMDHLLNKIAQLNNSITSERHEEIKTEILATKSRALSKIETQLRAMIEAEERICKEMNQLEGSEEECDASRNDRMIELENRKRNATNGRIELEAERDEVEETLLRELEEMERQNEGQREELEGAAEDVERHEATYQRLISDVLLEKETKRKEMVEQMNAMRKARDGRTTGEDMEEEMEEGELLDEDSRSSYLEPDDVTREDKTKEDEIRAVPMDKRRYLREGSGEDRTRSISDSVLPAQSPDRDDVERMLSSGECHLTRSGHSVLTNGTDERGCKVTELKKITELEDKVVGGFSRIMEKLVIVEEHPLEEEEVPGRGGGRGGGCERRKRSELDQHGMREMESSGGSPTKIDGNGGTSETTHSTTGNDCTLDSLSNSSSTLDNFPDFSSPSDRSLLVVCQFPSGSSSASYPFRIRIPCSIFRGSGLSTYVEFEVKVAVMDDEWTIFRRYRRFHQLHSDLLAIYSQVSSLEFPPKKLFTTEKVIATRRTRLEKYLRNLLEVLYNTSGCPLHPGRANVYCKQLLANFHPFFQKGIFETSKHSAC